MKRSFWVTPDTLDLEAIYEILENVVVEREEVKEDKEIAPITPVIMKNFDE